VAILDARRVAAEQACSFFHVALTKFPLFAELPQSFTDDHGGDDMGNLAGTQRHFDSGATLSC
jgi:hypothetical protein